MTQPFPQGVQGQGFQGQRQQAQVTPPPQIPALGMPAQMQAQAQIPHPQMPQPTQPAPSPEAQYYSSFLLAMIQGAKSGVSPEMVDAFLRVMDRVFGPQQQAQESGELNRRLQTIEKALSLSTVFGTQNQIVGGNSRGSAPPLP